jgi:hypothetical protein
MELLGGAQWPTPGSKGGGREITTPEQLRRVLQQFDEQMDASAGPTAFATPPSEYGAFGVLGGARPALSPSGTYRPSAVPKGTAAAPVRADGRLTVSLPEQRLAVMRRLLVTQDALEVSGASRFLG